MSGNIAIHNMPTIIDIARPSNNTLNVHGGSKFFPQVKSVKNEQIPTNSSFEKNIVDSKSDQAKNTAPILISPRQIRNVQSRSYQSTSSIPDIVASSANDHEYKSDQKNKDSSLNIVDFTRHPEHQLESAASHLARGGKQNSNGYMNFTNLSLSGLNQVNDVDLKNKIPPNSKEFKLMMFNESINHNKTTLSPVFIDQIRNALLSDKSPSLKYIANIFVSINQSKQAIEHLKSENSISIETYKQHKSILNESYKDIQKLSNEYARLLQKNNGKDLEQAYLVVRRGTGGKFVALYDKAALIDHKLKTVTQNLMVKNFVDVNMSLTINSVLEKFFGGTNQTDVTLNAISKYVKGNALDKIIALKNNVSREQSYHYINAGGLAHINESYAEIFDHLKSQQDYRNANQTNIPQNNKQIDLIDSATMPTLAHSNDIPQADVAERIQNSFNPVNNNSPHFFNNVNIDPEKWLAPFADIFKAEKQDRENERAKDKAFFEQLINDLLAKNSNQQINPELSKVPVVTQKDENSNLVLSNDDVAQKNNMEYAKQESGDMVSSLVNDLTAPQHSKNDDELLINDSLYAKQFDHVIDPSLEQVNGQNDLVDTKLKEPRVINERETVSDKMQDTEKEVEPLNNEFIPPKIASTTVHATKLLNTIFKSQPHAADDSSLISDKNNKKAELGNNISGRITPNLNELQSEFLGALRRSLKHVETNKPKNYTVNSELDDLAYFSDSDNSIINKGFVNKRASSIDSNSDNIKKQEAEEIETTRLPELSSNKEFEEMIVEYSNPREIKQAKLIHTDVTN